MPAIAHRLTEPPVAKAAMLVRRPVQEVFEALIDPEITSRFWFTKGSGKLETGRHICWDWEMYDASVQVSVKAVEPSERIVIEWPGDGAPTTVAWQFTPRADGPTFDSVENSGFSRDMDKIVQQVVDATEGFSLVLSGLKALLEHNVRLNLVTDRFSDGLDGP